jgi:EPS I polysaccharide export inner membrane protein EpsE
VLRGGIDLMLAGKSTHLLAASVLARMPNFVLPILAVRIFDFYDYSIFAVAFVTAAAVSAFLGEAIAATISRESYRIGHGEHGRASLAAFFRSAVLASYVSVMAGVSIYWLFFATANGDRWLLAAATILLVPAYLLPAATTALANASGLGNFAIAASLVGVPISVVLSFLLGARFGIAYYFVAYFTCVVLTNLFVYFGVASARYRSGLRAGGETLREYGLVFMTILLPALLGGPVHGLCMSILGHQKGGVAELAVFVAYYPWSIAVSVVAAVLANYVIQMVVEIRRRMTCHG